MVKTEWKQNKTLTLYCCLLYLAKGMWLLPWVVHVALPAPDCECVPASWDSTAVTEWVTPYLCMLHCRRGRYGEGWGKDRNKCHCWWACEHWIVNQSVTLTQCAYLLHVLGCWLFHRYRMTEHTCCRNCIELCSKEKLVGDNTPY